MSQFSNFLFPEDFLVGKEKMVDIFDTYIKDNTQKIYIALSGGPDSMLVCFLVFYYFFTNSLDVSRLVLCHFNHQQREESDDEEKILDKYFTGYTFLSRVYTGGKSTERDLRRARWEFLFSCVEKYGPGYIITGHHLSDRIETTFLNLMRGTGRKGLFNMSCCDKIGGYTILRPLLDISKSDIESWCDTYHIPYFIDKTNKDISVSLRNQVRYALELYERKYGSQKLYDNFKKLYTREWSRKEKQKKVFQSLDITPLQASKYWYTDKYFSFQVPLSHDQIYTLLEYINILSGISKKHIEIFKRFFQGKKGWKYKKGWYFFVSHGKGYVLYLHRLHGEKFWEKPPGESCFVDIQGYWELGDWSGKNIDCAGNKVRFPKQGDKWRGKSLKKHMINKKIPIFWRNYLPVFIFQDKVKNFFFVNEENW